MIVFLNFAPLSFGGGAERWMSAVATSLAAFEEVCVIQVDHAISNIYSKLVLHRIFDTRVTLKDTAYRQLFITWGSLIPLTSAWQRIRDEVQQASYIYTRLELNEVLLLLYFGGTSVFKRTVIGLHSPLFYNQKSLSFLGRLHNIVYNSSPIRHVLASAHRVHVLNPDQEKIMTGSFGLSNVVRIPNFIDDIDGVDVVTSNKQLSICFIGELDKRKGADILLQLIQKSPAHFHFHIVGDGYLKPAFQKLQSDQVTYHGYVDHKEVGQIIGESDVLFMPSKAESFSLVSLEALSHGLAVVCSSEISPNTLEEYLVISKTSTISEYLLILEDLFTQKKRGTLHSRREHIAAAINKKFSKKEIIKQLRNKLFA